MKIDGDRPLPVTTLSDEERKALLARKETVEAEIRDSREALNAIL